MAKLQPRKVSSGKGRAVIGGICCILMFVILIFGILAVYKSEQREIEIVTFKRDMSIGTEITAADIEVGTILKAEYDDKEDESYISNDGVSKKEQIYVKWKERDEVLGQFVTNSRRVSDPVTRRDISTEEIEPNPWYSGIPFENELYTMKFDASDVYTRMLMPGATVRMRIITEVPVEAADEYRQQIANKSAAGDGIENTNGYISAVLPFYTASTTDSESSEKIPIAEVVFENLTILDAMNDDGESIFDIYYSLNNMDSTVCESYIRENAEDLRERLIPASLIMSLTPEQATSVAEFENIDKTAYKYTVVKKQQQDDLYVKFMDIGTRINTITINSDDKD